MGSGVELYRKETMRLTPFALGNPASRQPKKEILWLIIYQMDAATKI